ncbi:PH domain-containing protein [Arthrobacter sp. JSM 101049]|uniref:PH domain-containing protein n=1 Tax=Arthrobacter sp. JSM 101049 TaxID=929097 RepID=UPI00356A34CA
MTGTPTEPAGPQEAGSDAAPWHRVHPVSPLVRGWIAVLAILYFFGQNSLENLFNGADRSGDDGSGWSFNPGLLWLVVGGVGILLLIVGAFFLSWYFTKYQVTGQHVNVNSGIVFRQQRQARIDRVQAIDIVQPLLARIFGLAELKFEVADAGSTAMRLAFIKIDHARELRTEILSRAAGLKQDRAAGTAGARPAVVPDPATASGPGAGETGNAEAGTGFDGGATPAPDAGAPAAASAPAENGPWPAGESERVVVVVPPRRMVAATLLSPWVGFTLLAVIGGLVATVATDGEFSVLYMIPFLIGVVPALWGQFNQGYNFRAALGADGLRLSYGLLDTRHQTVPPGRVQAVMVTQGIIWRRFGWHKVVVNVAGYGGQGEDAALRSTVLPVGTRQDVLNVLGIVLPDPGTTRPAELVEAGVAGTGDAEGFTSSPRSARWLSPFEHRRQGFAVTDTALFSRAGVLIHSLVVVPHERIQGIILTQGPLDRRLGLSGIQLCTTDGPISPRVKQMGLDTGRRLFMSQAERAATARRLNDRDHWLEGEHRG